MVEPGTLAIPYYAGERSGTSDAIVVISSDHEFSTVISIEGCDRNVCIMAYCTSYVQEHAWAM